MILTALRTYFLSRSAITDLLDNRLFIHQIQPGVAMPCADMRLVSSVAQNYIGGWTKMSQGRVVVDCYSEGTPDGAIALATAIRDSGIIGYRGSSSGTFIHGVELEDDVSLDTEGVAPGSVNYRYVATVAFGVDYSG